MSEMNESNSKKTKVDNGQIELRENIKYLLSVFRSNPLEVIDQIILGYKSLETVYLKFFNYEDLCNLILLYLIKESYSDALCYKEKAFFYKLINEKTNLLFTPVEAILVKLKTNPYSNIYENLLKLYGFGTDTQTIAEVFLYIYEQKQAFFLSTIYKNISEDSLIDLLKPHIAKESLTDYAKKYNINIRKSNNKVFYSFETFNISNVEKNLTGEFQTQPNFIKEPNYVLNNLTFVNNKANELENLAKANFLLQNK